MHAKFFASSGSATVISSIINWHKKINQELNSQINIAFGTTTIKENEDNPTNNDEQYNKANLELTNSSVTSTHGSSKRFGCFFFSVADELLLNNNQSDVSNGHATLIQMYSNSKHNRMHTSRISLNGSKCHRTEFAVFIFLA